MPRYETMRGRRVERRFGWDCHGLPAEVEAEKQLGITHKSQIEELGVAAFNDACRTSVLRYTKDWEEYVTRQARWVDFEHDYKTLDLDYMESVLWAFKTLWDKGLVYEGFRVLAVLLALRDAAVQPPRPRMDDVYRQRQDPARHRRPPARDRRAAARLDDDPVDPAEQPGGRRAARTSTTSSSSRRTGAVRGPPVRARRRPGWRTTPASSATRRTVVAHGCRAASWSGLALHAALRLLRRARANAHQRARRRLRDHRRRHGRRAPGARPSARTTRSPRTPPASSRSSPSTRRAGSPPRCRTTPACRCSRPTSRSSRDLRDRARRSGAVLLRQETYDHPYPHCWRCDNPLIYKAVSSLVREGERLPATAWSSSTSRSAGCRSTSRTARSASGSRTPATGRSAATGTGAARSRCG